MNIEYMQTVLNININSGIIPNTLILNYKEEKKINFKATPLVDAFLRKNDVLIKELFSNSTVNIFASDNVSKITPAIACIITNNMPFLKCIINDKYFNSPVYNTSELKHGDTKCTICFNNIIENGVKIVGCSHQYHEQCIDKWTREFDAKTTEPTCPNCKKEYSTFIKIGSNYGINRQDQYGNTLLHYAVMFDNVMLFKYLLSITKCRKNVDIKNVWNHDIYELIDKVKTRKQIIFYKALMRQKFSLDLILLYASGLDDISFVSYLINKKANVNFVMTHKTTDTTPLLSACLYEGKQYTNNTKIIELLIDANANINHVDNDGDPILTSCLSNINVNQDACKLLIDKNADLYKRDSNGHNAIQTAHILYYDSDNEHSYGQYGNIYPYIVNKQFPVHKYKVETDPSLISTENCTLKQKINDKNEWIKELTKQLEQKNEKLKYDIIQEYEKDLRDELTLEIEKKYKHKYKINKTKIINELKRNLTNSIEKKMKTMYKK